MYQKAQSGNKLFATGAVILKTKLSKCTHRQDRESQPDPEPIHLSRNHFLTLVSEADPKQLLTLGSEPDPKRFLTLGSEVDSEPSKIQATPGLEPPEPAHSVGNRSRSLESVNYRGSGAGTV